MTIFSNYSPMTFADISGEEYIYNEAGVSAGGTVIGKAARRVAAMARIIERSFSISQDPMRPMSF